MKIFDRFFQISEKLKLTVSKKYRHAYHKNYKHEMYKRKLNVQNKNGVNNILHIQIIFVFRTY